MDADAILEDPVRAERSWHEGIFVYSLYLPFLISLNCLHLIYKITAYVSDQSIAERDKTLNWRRLGKSQRRTKVEGCMLGFFHKIS